jgi:hypothetical protein
VPDLSRFIATYKSGVAAIRLKRLFRQASQQEGIADMRIQPSDLNGCEVTQHPYRSARVTGDMETFSYHSGDEVDKLSQALANMATTPDGRRARVDNHVTYRIILADGQLVCVQFSDWKAYFGSELVTGRW